VNSSTIWDPFFFEVIIGHMTFSHQINMLWPGLLGMDKYEFAKTYCAVRVVRDSQGKFYQDFSKGIGLEELNVLLRQTIMLLLVKLKNLLSFRRALAVL